MSSLYPVEFESGPWAKLRWHVKGCSGSAADEAELKQIMFLAWNEGRNYGYASVYDTRVHDRNSELNLGKIEH